MLIERYNEVKKHVEEACKRVGRDPREVTVIAVSKTKPLEMVEELRKEKYLILERIRYRRSRRSAHRSRRTRNST